MMRTIKGFSEIEIAILNKKEEINNLKFGGTLKIDYETITGKKNLNIKRDMGFSGPEIVIYENAPFKSLGLDSERELRRYDWPIL